MLIILPLLVKIKKTFFTNSFNEIYKYKKKIKNSFYYHSFLHF